MLVVGVKGDVKLVGLGVQLSDTVGRVSCILETLQLIDVVGTGRTTWGRLSIGFRVDLLVGWLVGWSV